MTIVDELECLDCHSNNLVELNNLPFSIQVLNCLYTLITNLDYLPEIIELNVNSNPKPLNLSNLPSSLKKLAFNDKISILLLPKNLKYVYAPTDCMDLNYIKSKKYKPSNKNFKIIQKKITK